MYDLSFRIRSSLAVVIYKDASFVILFRGIPKMSDIPPGNNPVPDDQGDLDECSRYALGKAVASGFMKKKTVPGQEIDVDQDQVSAVLCNQEGLKVYFWLR